MKNKHQSPRPAAQLFAAVLALMALGLTVGGAHARTPTKLDQQVCQQHGDIAQRALEIERAAHAGQIDQQQYWQLRRPLIQEATQPHYSHLFIEAMGSPIETPPWVTDVRAQYENHCLQRVKLDMFPYWPGAPENRSRENTPDAHIGTITRLPSANEAPTVAPSAPPPEDVFEGSFDGPMRPITVLFRRHALICLGRTQAQIIRQGLAPATTCSIRETPTAYVVGFSQSSSFGEVTVPYATMRPAKAAKADVE